MGLTLVSPHNKKKEENLLLEIYNSIDSNKSLVFNSGAGAGKTYSLVECLKYVLNFYGKTLKENNQRVICVTYTNIATKEVKERLGNTELVMVSTIHERVWEIIKDFQNELTKIHRDKLKDEVDNLREDLKCNENFIMFKSLQEHKKIEFISIMIKEKEEFYKNYNARANVVKEVFKDKLYEFPNVLRNVAKFKKLVTTIYKLENYKECICNIDLKKQKFQSVIYTTKYNRDQLHKMQISHDTLLDYGLRIIEKYDLLKQIIIDKFPFIFIDEYQDTNEKVILIMKILDKYAQDISHRMVIGYFGDTAQNIFVDGVGSQLNEIHSGLKKIEKEFNRRSTKEVIEVTNKIRNDEIKQISIYDDCSGGSTKFYVGDNEDVQAFISKYIDQWNITENKPLDCLVLTNKTVAEFSGFNNIYSAFRHTAKYGGQNYDLLNTELLSNDISKLGEVPKLLFNLIKLKNDLTYEDTPIVNFKVSTKNKSFDKLSVKELQELILDLKKINGETLQEYIESIFLIYIHENRTSFKNTIDLTAGFERFSFEYFRSFIFNKLFPNILEDEYNNANETLEKLLDIKLNEYDLWYKYILRTQQTSVRYHTYHGTKGLEFENVIIIMENTFGRERDFFNFFFENYDIPNLDSNDKIKFERVQNLLYVSCSRAVKNLRLLYTDDVLNFESGVKAIFGEINKFKGY